MAPPSYSDFGKEARDIFSKNYHSNVIKLDCKTKSPLGMEFNLVGNSSTETGKADASLETKYSINNLGSGTVIKEKWSSNNILSSEITIQDLIVKGSKVGATANFSPVNCSKNFQFKSSLKKDLFNVNLDLDANQNAWMLKGMGVIQYQGWAVGGNVNFDLRAKKLGGANVALGYISDDFTIHTTANNGQEFTGSIYQKLNSQTQTGMQVTFNNGSSVANFAFGCIYKLDSQTSLRAKVNNNSQIGLGMSHQLNSGITLHLSTILDGKNFTQGGHKFGVGLEIAAYWD